MKLNKIRWNLCSQMFFLWHSVQNIRTLNDTTNSRNFIHNIFTPPKVYVHFHSKIIQHGLLVELRLKIGPFWAQNASPLHFEHYHSSKMTTIGAKFCQTVKWYSKQAWSKVETTNKSETRHLHSSTACPILMSL
jgi:hypothetical protein